MLTRILHHSDKLCTFLDQLDLELTQPQRRHILNMADALLVCEDKKTLAALQRQLVEAPDPSNMADFLRISPWQANKVRAALQAHQVAWLIAEGERLGAPKVIYINIDDSLGEKDKDTRHLEPVDRFFDHSEGPYKNVCYVVCTMRVGPNVATVDLRLYLREKTVRRLNRKRPQGQRLPFRSKYRIARQILVELAPLLPKGWKVYVQFDCWYASRRLIPPPGVAWHLWAHGRSTPRHPRPGAQAPVVHAGQRDHCGRGRTNLLCATAGWPFSRSAFTSRRGTPGRNPRRTFLTCSAKQALPGYAWRWSCETVNFYLKTQAGLEDFRVQSYEAVDKYLVIVHLAWAYVEQRFAQERSATVRTYGDIIRQHRDEHAIDWLEGAIQMAIETGDPERVLRRFLRLEAPPA
ncbi:MAG: transposase [Chloroflexia bacterium]